MTTTPDIPERHREVLISIAEDFESGRIKAGTPTWKTINEKYRDHSKRPTKYNQGYEHCGTYACIGGHMAWRLKAGDPLEFVNRASSNIEAMLEKREPLNKVYWPLFYGRSFGGVSEREGAAAIRRFLAGEDPWPNGDYDAE